MDIENLNSQMRKGMLEYCILLLLDHGDAYASQIISRLKQAHMIVVEGTLYPLLTRLKNAEALTYRWEESPSGPPRKYYSLTDKGRVNLKTLHNVWAEITNTINLLSNDTTNQQQLTNDTQS